MPAQTMDTMEAATGTSASELYNENLEVTTEEAENGQASSSNSQNLGNEQTILTVLKVAEGAMLILIVIGILGAAVYLYQYKNGNDELKDVNKADEADEVENKCSVDNAKEKDKLLNALKGNGIVEIKDAEYVANRMSRLLAHEGKEFQPDKQTQVVRSYLLYFTKFSTICEISLDKDDSEIDELTKAKRSEYIQVMTVADLIDFNNKDKLSESLMKYLDAIDSKDSLDELINKKADIQSLAEYNTEQETNQGSEETNDEH